MMLLRLMMFVWSHPLNRGGRFRAISRLLRWQLASRLLPEATFIVPFVNDCSLLMRKGMTGATGNWYCGLDEAVDMAFVLHALRPGDLFVDIGANVGSYTILAAGGAGADVIAVEPIPSTRATLSGNVCLNRLESRVEICGMGLSNQAGQLRFTTALDSVNHVLAEGEDTQSTEIPVTTLDDLLQRGDVARAAALIKIDVEGHELAVLLGGRRTFSCPQLLAVVMETNGSGARYGVGDRQLFDVMRGYGLDPYSYDANSRRLRRLEGSPKGKGNTIFVRDADRVQERVMTASKARLVNGWV